MDIRKLEEEKQQLVLQLDDADKAGLEAETLLPGHDRQDRDAGKGPECCCPGLLPFTMNICRRNSLALQKRCTASGDCTCCHRKQPCKR